jgi:hypothetical protein
MNKYTLACGFDSAQPPRVERSRNLDGYLLYRESPNICSYANISEVQLFRSVIRHTIDIYRKQLEVPKTPLWLFLRQPCGKPEDFGWSWYPHPLDP